MSHKPRRYHADIEIVSKRFQQSRFPVNAKLGNVVINHDQNVATRSLKTEVPISRGRGVLTTGDDPMGSDSVAADLVYQWSDVAKRLECRY